MKKLLLLAVLTAAAPAAAFAGTTSEWEIDPNHSNAQFVVRHLKISNVQGQFTRIAGTIRLDEKDVTRSSVAATIDVNSLDTRVAMRDNDLKSPNYFDAAKFPAMTFKSKKLTRSAEGKTKMIGDLTIHGVTRETAFDVDGPTDAIQDPWGNSRRGASAVAKIRRTDFGMDRMVGPIGDEIAVTLDIEMVKKK